MKKHLLIIISLGIILISGSKTFAQSIGFSYFIPANGYFSNPISPFNFGYTMGFKYLRIEPGISMYSMGGTSMTGFDDELDAKRPLVGPYQTIKGSLVPKIVIPGKSLQFEIMGGVFGFASMNTKLIQGNFDKMYSEAYNYQAVTSDLEYEKDAFGGGYVFGGKIGFRIMDNIWGYIEGKYYIGSQNMPLSGQITAATEGYDIVNYRVDYPETALSFQGFEITLGGEMRKK